MTPALIIALLAAGSLAGYALGVRRSRASVDLWRRRAEAAAQRAAEWEAEVVRVARRQSRTLAPSPRSAEELLALGWCVSCGTEPRSPRCAACIRADAGAP